MRLYVCVVDIHINRKDTDCEARKNTVNKTPTSPSKPRYDLDVFIYCYQTILFFSQHDVTTLTLERTVITVPNNHSATPIGLRNL